MQGAQVFAELFEVGFARIKLGQPLRFQQAAHLAVEVVAQLP